MANISTNLLNATLPVGDVTTVNAAITTIDTTLDPVERTLTDEERASLLALDVSNKVFAEEALQELTANGSMMPPSLSPTFLSNDLANHVHVPEHDMTAEATVGRHRAFKVHGIAR